MTEELRSQVCDLLHRYAKAIDERDWDLLASCFTQDVTVNYNKSGDRQGRDDLIASMERHHSTFGPSLHSISNVVVELRDGVIRATSHVDAILTKLDGSEPFRARGIYNDIIVRGEDAGLRLAARAFLPVHVSG